MSIAAVSGIEGVTTGGGFCCLEQGCTAVGNWDVCPAHAVQCSRCKGDFLASEVVRAAELVEDLRGVGAADVWCAGCVVTECTAVVNRTSGLHCFCGGHRPATEAVVR